jgi:sulfane dehydrogenase subunit SoxC
VTIKGLIGKGSCVLTMDDIRGRPSITTTMIMECAGNGRTFMRPRFNKHVPWNGEAVSQATWTGCSLRDLLLDKNVTGGLLPSAVDAVFTGADWYACWATNEQLYLTDCGECMGRGVVNHKPLAPNGLPSNPKECQVVNYQRSLNLEVDRVVDSCLLAYEMNGRPLEPQHGAPIRLLVPGWYGMASVKWLTTIDIIDHVIDGFPSRSHISSHTNISCSPDVLCLCVVM